jgi:hypothetical protein
MELDFVGKSKFSLQLTKWTQRHEDVWGSGGISAPEEENGQIQALAALTLGKEPPLSAK